MTPSDADQIADAWIAEMWPEFRQDIVYSI
jgi:hypothetical protein